MRTRDVSPSVGATARRVVIAATATMVASALLLTPAGTGRAAEPTSTPAPRQIAVADEAVAWTPSANARVTTIRPRTSTQALQVRPKRTSGRKNVSARSSVSSDVVGSAGTTVTASARMRTSQPGRRLRLRVYEVKDGRRVASRSVSIRPFSTGWRTVTVRLRTTRDASRVQLQAYAKRLSGSRLVRLTDIGVTVAAGPTVPGTPPVTTACEDIDYSQPGQGVRTFSEEFSGSSIDRSRWRVRDDTFLNQDQAWITKDAVTVHDGFLDITGKRLPEHLWKTNTQATYPENRIRNYSTGYVDTIDDAGYGNAAGDRFGQKYGHFEVRAWVPSEATMSRGIWPAFWLRADHKRGEIDPLESYGAPTIRNYDPSSSYEWNSWHDTLQEWSKDHTQGTANVGTDKIWQGWHTYGVNWSPGCLRYLYDGRTVGIVDFDDPDTKPYFRGDTFDDTFHVRLNLQVGTKYWGWADPQHTRNEFSYKVDWVRVHQGTSLLADR